jgi:hypothetical protein
MPTIFWTGKLSLPMMLVVNANNILAWLTGNARDTAAMKNRVRQGYDGAFSEHVIRYDEAYDFFAAISSAWWYAKVPLNKRDEETRRTRDYFERKGVVKITDDIILVYGRKP